MRTFFRRQPDPNFPLFQNLLGHFHSYSVLHFLWTSSWLDWITLFVKLRTETFIRAIIDNNMITFFVENPDKKLFLFQNLLGWIHTYFSPHSIWTCPWLDLKLIFVKLHTYTFLSAKFCNDLITFFVFFVDKKDINFLLIQNLLGCIHSYSSPNCVSLSSWHDWKTLFVKLRTETFIRANFDEDMRTFS